MGLSTANCDHLLVHLSRLLAAASERDLLLVLAETIEEVDGTAFDIIRPARDDLAAIPGMIGWCEDVEGSSARRAAGGRGRPVFWGTARIGGVHARGRFRFDPAEPLDFVDGLLAPLPLGATRGLLLHIAVNELSEELAHLLAVLCLAGARRLAQLRARALEAEPLSARERQVLGWLAEGKSAEDVGEILQIAPATVMFHYRSVATKYGTLNRTHTVIEAVRRGALRLG